jgi:arsenate reductase (thioredoxin)
MKILFLCTGNSCRSILAEAIFNALAPEGMRAMSAGSKPKGQIHPRTITLLIREGIKTDGYYSKSWDYLPSTPDIVITVCGNAAGETCPAYLGNVIRAHWGVEDPDGVTGTEAEIEVSFMHAYQILRKRIEAFLKLDAATLADRDKLKEALDKIGLIV